jgi:carboxyl-terminal processing protease
MTSTHPLFLGFGLGLVLLCVPAGPAAVKPAAVEAAAVQGGADAAHPAQDAKELARLIDERVHAVESVPTKQVWQDAEALVAAVKGSDAAAIDPLFDARLARTDLSERAQLLLVGTRLSLPTPDYGVLAPKLTALLGSKDDEVGRAAANMAANRGFKGLRDDEAEALLKRLSDGAKDGTRSPEYRLECGVALHVQGNGEAKRSARKEMMEFQASSDLHLRNLGALALARVGDVETGRADLERMAALPGEEGRLAEAYLKREDDRTYYERREKNLLAKKQKDDDTVKVDGDHDLALVEKVIRMVEHSSLEGDKHTRTQLIDSAIDGMLRSLDEHSSYLTPKLFKGFEQELLQAEYGGIGAYVGEDAEDHLFTIRQPIYSGPAYRAGLHTDDKVVRIDDWPTLTPGGSKPTDDIIKRLKGKPGTKVKLYIWRHGMDPALIDRPTEDMAIEIMREEITIPPVKAQALPGGIGLVQLTTFSRVASDELRTKIADMLKHGAKGMILDLRNNSGGLLTEARDVANLFLPKGELVVTTESRSQESEKLSTRSEPLIPKDMPVAVLINGFSASASEIVSGALQDHERAVLVGQRSFGKGSVQQLLPIPGEKDDEYIDENHNGRYDPWEKLTKDWNGNGEFDFGPRARLTVARYLLPSGRSIHREIDDQGVVTQEGGVVPEEVVVPRRYEAWKVEEMRRLHREHKIRDYVDAKYKEPANAELFKKLSECDEDDIARYPGFQDFYNSLSTTLSTQEVRLLVRAEVRGKVQDARGAAFPDGDFEEDLQLQKALRVVLEKLKTSWTDVPEYATTFEPDTKEGSQASRLLAAGMSDTARSSLRHVLALISEAKSGGQLSPERLDALEKALQAVLDK